MILKCAQCESKFSIFEDEVNLEDKLITCKHCNESWIYKNKIDYLENLLSELDKDLNNTEEQINELRAIHNKRINELEEDLKTKKEEVKKQILLEDKIIFFEKRITQTEKECSIQADLENKLFQMENEEKKLSESILNKNIKIEKKTKYLNMKVNSYNKPNIDEILIDEKPIKVSSGTNDIIDFNDYESTEKKEKNKFFWPNMTKPKNSK